MGRPLFELGRVVMTRAAAVALQQAQVAVGPLLKRHECGDWATLPPDARIANERAVLYGGEVASSFSLSAEDVCLIITEANRTLTSVLMSCDLPAILAAEPGNRESVLRAEADAASIQIDD